MGRKIDLAWYFNYNKKLVFYLKYVIKSKLPMDGPSTLILKTVISIVSSHFYSDLKKRLK